MLRSYGASNDEIIFLCGDDHHDQRRVELNAMTSDQFIAWVWEALERHGAGKVVPDNARVEAKARHTPGALS